MCEFSGNIKYTCDKCGDSGEIPAEDFSVSGNGSNERGMGAEIGYGLKCEINCSGCNSEIELDFDVWIYPVGVVNSIVNNSKGAETEGEPEYTCPQ